MVGERGSSWGGIAAKFTIHGTWIGIPEEVHKGRWTHVQKWLDNPVGKARVIVKDGNGSLGV